MNTSSNTYDLKLIDRACGDASYRSTHQMGVVPLFDRKEIRERWWLLAGHHVPYITNDRHGPCALSQGEQRPSPDENSEK